MLILNQSASKERWFRKGPKLIQKPDTALSEPTAEPCCATPNGAPWGMISARDTSRPRGRDTKFMFAVRYSNVRSAYIRVSPHTARHGNLVVLDVARERQEAGEIPEGIIVSV